MRFLMWTALLAFLATPALAEPVKATYGLYTGGVKMIDVSADLDYGAPTYDMRVKGQTTGVFSKLLPWTGTFATQGKGDFLPAKHDYTVKWRGDAETLSFVYEPIGVIKSVTETKDGTITDKTPEAEITKDTRDMLSTIGALLQRFEKTGKCAGETLAFDGKRSLIVQATDAGQTVLSNAKLSSYTGPAYGCAIKIIPQKGKWPEKPRGWMKIQKMSEAGGKLPTLWLARPVEGKPAIPVRIDIHTKYGDVIAHLTAVQ